MQVRHATHPRDLPRLDNQELRDRFVATDLFAPGEVRTVYTHHDRMVIGGAVPVSGQPLALRSSAPLRSDHFCQRRELAVVCVGDAAHVTVDGTVYDLSRHDVLYVGRGAKEVTFESSPTTGGENSDPSVFLVSALAHVELPTTLIRLADAQAFPNGSPDGANERVIYRHLHEDGFTAAQLVLGITVLSPGSVWNTMPCHLHDRRTEVYLYMDLSDRDRVNHVMGEPHETRRLTLANREAVISPSWSVHYGAGTSNYSFVWVMAGENQSFADMDMIHPCDLA